MRHILQTITSVLCAGFLLASLPCPAVKAAEETEFTLPSGKTLAEVQTALDDIDREQGGNEPQYASAVIGIFQGDEVLDTRCYGFTDMENQIPADENSVYEWGSISKTFIWVSAMQLYEQGKLDLDRDVREYLPSDFFQHLTYDEPITMLHLMNHTAGWQETTRPIEVQREEDVLPLKEALQSIEPAQIHRPGEVHAYSNYGAAVAGYVIECITGQDYCNYVHEHILEPLGMEHTSINPTHSDNAWVQAQRKSLKCYQFMLALRIRLGDCLNYISAYPAGAAAGTIGDLMTYAQALCDDSAPLFEDPQTQELMYKATTSYGDSGIPMNAHGFWYSEYAVRTCGHNGATTAGQAVMSYDLESKTGVVVLCNEPRGNAFLSLSAQLVFGDLSPEKYAETTCPARDLSGTFTPARDIYQGMLKLSNTFSGVQIDSLGEVQNLGSGLYQIVAPGEQDEPDSAMLFSECVTPDDRLTAVRLSSCDYLPDRAYAIKLVLLTLYFLLAIAAVFLLLIRRKLKKHGKWKPYKGSTLTLLGWLAWLGSVVTMLAMFMVYLKFSGMPYIAGAVIGVLQMLLLAVCAIAAIHSCIILVREKRGRAFKIGCIANAVCCLIPIANILTFELYRFWGC